MEWIVLVVLVILLLAAVGPRAGFYGTAGIVWDALSLIVLIVLVYWILVLLNVI